MSARIIDGKAIARAVRDTWRDRVRALSQRGIKPGLAVIVVGEDPASTVYVGNKVKACAELGIRSRVFQYEADDDERAVIQRIQALNNDAETDGILVQLPLPSHWEARKVLGAISVGKDVDGFHLYNVGGLVVGDGTVFPPCTPYGVQCLLEHEGIPIEGQNVVVVGASNVVGKPLALLLMAKEATVSICHVKTRELAQYTILADILVVAAGCPKLITAPMVARGAVVIDVGITRMPDGKLVGDVDFEAVREKASFITPVPGGVGPMTVTMLLGNTLAAAERRIAGACVT